MGVTINQQSAILLIIAGNLIAQSLADTWYKGCYTLPHENVAGRVEDQPLFVTFETLTPAKCSKRCISDEYNYAFLTSGSNCFCRTYLTRKTWDANCNQRCTGDPYTKCGSSELASVFTTRGPFIKTAQVIVNPKKVVRYQDVTITILVELAADASSKTGIKRFDRMSLDEVNIQIRLSQAWDKHVIKIEGRTGELVLKHAYTEEGIKRIDVELENRISTKSARSMVQVSLRMPSLVEIEDVTIRGTMPSCIPRTIGLDIDPASALAGEKMEFRAFAKHGFNLTFVWEFCDKEIRKISTHDNPMCRLALCLHDTQEYTFDKPGTCRIKVRVYNKFGSVRSSLLVRVLEPKFRDLTIRALPYKFETRRFDSPQFTIPPWEYPQSPAGDWEGGLEEGGTEDSRILGLGGPFSDDPPARNQPPPNLFPFAPPPSNENDEEEKPDHHRPLEEGQYLKETKVSFEASLYMISDDARSVVEINFGDDTVITQSVITDNGMSESRGKRDTFTDVTKLTFGEKMRLISHSRSRRSLNYLDFGHLNTMDPYAPDPTNEFVPRSGGFGISEGGGFNIFTTRQDDIAVEYDDDCLMHMTFGHEYSKAGTYNVTMRVYNGTHSLLATVSPPIFVLDGTPALNIRCPVATEIGKSIILPASSTTGLPDFLTWKITTQSDIDNSWISVFDKEQPGSTLKKSFLSRGTYKVEVEAPTEDLSSTCLVQVEERLSKLSVVIAKTFVRVGDEVEMKISLGAGSAAIMHVQFGSEKKIASVDDERKRMWSARFRVTDPKCYVTYVVARNRVSNITSGKENVCGEEQISGFTMEMKKYQNLGGKTSVTFRFESGSNISLAVNVLSLSGRSLASYNREVDKPDAGGVSIVSPKFTHPGIYRVQAHAKNHVTAKSDNCDSVTELTTQDEITIARMIHPNTKLTLSRRQIQRGKDNQGETSERVFVFVATLDDSLADGIDVLYRWTVQNVSSEFEDSGYTIRYAASPLLAVSLSQCDVLSTSSEDVKHEEGDFKLSQWSRCKIAIDVISRSGNASQTHTISSQWNQERQAISQTTILPQTSVIEARKSCEFDIKCPADETDMCQVSFGDDSEPMKIPSNANWNSLSHAFTVPGLYEVILESTQRNGKTTLLNKTNVVVQENIWAVVVKGTELLSFEEDARGAWQATVTGGSHKIYHWLVSYKNDTLLHDEYTREQEWEYIFPDYGMFVIRIVVFNDISSQSSEMQIAVQRAPWYFTAQTNSSVLGEPSIFVVETNATNSLLAVRFYQSGELETYDLSCLKPNAIFKNDEDRIVYSYVISHKYNGTGSYQASFTLLSRTEDDRTKQLYTLKTEVLHKPAPKQLIVTLTNMNVVHEDGVYYVAARATAVITASTNYRTDIFSWIVFRRHGSRKEILYSTPTEARNHTTAEFSYMIEHQGVYEISATSHPNVLSSSVLVKAEEPIRNVWIDEPFKDPNFVNFCRLKRKQVNGSFQMQCDDHALGARSDGTNVNFTFRIHFREEVLDDYSVPTHVIDVIHAQATKNEYGSQNEVSIDYTFAKQGVYYITVTASNHLGSRTTAREETTFGETRPYLFYAQRSVTKIALAKETYYVPINQLETFELIQNNPNQVLRIEWRMGDGTTRIGKKVEHRYEIPGSLHLEVSAKNLVGKKQISAEVKVEIPIQSVKLREMHRVYSTEEAVRLQTMVTPSKSAWNFTWYLQNNETTKTVLYSSYIDHHFPKSDHYLVKVIAANRINAIHSEPIEIQIQEPIRAVFIGNEVVLRNREVEMEVRLITGTQVSFLWSIDDGRPIAKTRKIRYTFTSIGVYTVRIDLSNQLARGDGNRVEKRIFVVDKLCSLPDVHITGQSRILQITRSKPLRLEAEVDLNCSYVAEVDYHWTAHVYSAPFSTESVDQLMNYDIDTRNRVLQLPPRTLQYGEFVIKANVSIVGSILFSVSSVLVRVSHSKLVALIDGGTVRTMSRDSEVVIDASPSYDPDFPDHKLIFEWQCFVLNTPNKPCFHVDESDNEADNEDTTTTIYSRSSPLPTSAMRAAEPYRMFNDESEDKNNVYKKFPTSVSTNSSLISFSASLFVPSAETFVFKVEVSKLSRRIENATIVIKVNSGNMEWVRVTSPHSIRGNAVVRHASLRFDADCVTCLENEDHQITYRWSLLEIDNSASFYENETSDCAPPDGSGWMRLIGIFGNDSEETNGSDYDPVLTYVMNNGTTFLHPDDSNFTGNLVPEFHQPSRTRKGGLLDLFPNSPSQFPREPDISEGRSPSRTTNMDLRPISPQDRNVHVSEPESGSSPRFTPAPPRVENGKPKTSVSSSEYNSEQDSDQPTTSSENSNMRDGYGIGGQAPFGGRSSPLNSNPEEGDTGFRNLFEHRWNSNPYRQGGNFQSEYRSGIQHYNPPLPNHLIGDAFRNEEVSSGMPSVKHYQDASGKVINLSGISLTGINKDTLILRPNSLIEGKTYAVAVYVESRFGPNRTTISSGNTSYYFTVLRGPSYGECSVVERKTFKVHCIQWKNQQNDNADDDISRGEMLNYDISYSLTRNGPTRQVYSGVSFDRSVQLPTSDKPEYIHIVLRNSDGASTNVCSFPVNVTRGNRSMSDESRLEEAYIQSVPPGSKLKMIMAKNDQEETIALVNVILDTVPKYSHLARTSAFEHSIARKRVTEIMHTVIEALQSIEPRKSIEVKYILNALIRALSHPHLLSVRAAFEAADLLIYSIESMRYLMQLEADGGVEQGVIVLCDEDLMSLMVLARFRLSSAFRFCLARIARRPRSQEVKDAELMQGLNTTGLGTSQRSIISVRDRLIEVERSVFGHMDQFFIGLVVQRPAALGPLRSAVDERGILVQRFDQVATLYDDYNRIVRNPEIWKVGTVFPDRNNDVQTMEPEASSPVFQIVSTLPDSSIGNYDRMRIERKPMSLTIFNGTGKELHIRDLSPPIFIALPPRAPDKTVLRGIVFRDRVTINSFPIIKRLNQTLHLEIILETKNTRSFPVTVAVTDEKGRHSAGVTGQDSMIARRMVSRSQFQTFRELNSSIVIKFTLRDRDFLRPFGTYYVSLWNEQSMTSRSRHYDIERIAYSLRVWWSDCYYWNDFFAEWRQDGLHVLDKSTSTQTLCTTTHLSTFSASYQPVGTDSHASDIGLTLHHTALRGSSIIIVVVLLLTAAVLLFHHRILRPRAVETPTSIFRTDHYGKRPKFSEISRRLRWFFGPDHKANAVPVILHDNRKTHEQVYEVTVQTCCWPGSGTTSNVSIILYGEEGKYEARELITPKTHSARESRHETGYSENDDYTGVDDELFITGSTQTFIITFPRNLGSLWKMTVWHDHTGECPRWKIDYVTVRDVTNGEKWHFPYYDWLALDRGRKALYANLRPIHRLPGLPMQMAVKANALLCNFSSVCSLVASPGYSHLARSQRAIHLFTLFITVCALTTSRYMLGWDIYSHDADLPYIHTVSITWGMLIGLVASFVILPAQLLLRFSKHDERVSVTIEDVTGSTMGSDFPGERGSFQYTSSSTLGKYKNSYHSQSDLGRKSPLKQGDVQEITEYIAALPSVEDTVVDWLELKEWAEHRNNANVLLNEVNKEHPLPEASTISSHVWHQSMSSFDEEIARCMMTSSLSRRAGLRHDSPSKAVEGQQHVAGHYLTVPNVDYVTSPRSRRTSNFTNANPSSVIDDKISSLAMDGPELVPCEKLEPIPHELNALLPRGCRKFAWCYYVILCVCACTVTLYGCVTMIRSYDLGPWLECIAFSLVGALVFIEGSLILLASIGSVIFGLLRYWLCNDDLADVLDRVFSTDKFAGAAENSLDIYIDSTTYYPGAGKDPNGFNDESLLEDARIARELADRERSRYLRHVQPPVSPPGARENLMKVRDVKKASESWKGVFFVLIMSAILSGIISSDFTESMAQSRDVEAWFKHAVALSNTGGYVTMASTADKHSPFSYQNIRSREDWINWFEKLLLNCPKSDEEKNTWLVNDMSSPASELLRDVGKTRYSRIAPEESTRYILIGRPKLTIHQYEKRRDPTSIPPKIATILNFSSPPTAELQRDSKIPEVNAMLSGSSVTSHPEAPVQETVISFEIPSWLSNDKQARKELRAIKKRIRDNPAVNAVAVDMILYNPHTNLYSQISALSQFQSINGYSNSTQTIPTPTVSVSSLALSQSGVDRSLVCDTRKAFYLCQLLLLMWCTYKLMRFIVSLVNFTLRRLTASVTVVLKLKNIQRLPTRTKVMFWILDLGIWALVCGFLVYSSFRRRYIETVVPLIYGYGFTDDIETGRSFSVALIAQCATRLSTVLGLLNFLLVVKLMYVAKVYHDFPKIPSFAKNRKTSFAEVMILIMLFWGFLILLAFIGHLIFSDDESFKTTLCSIATVALSAVSLGTLPINTPADMTLLRSKYGTLATLWFFFTIFVTFRLVLRAYFIAAYGRRFRGGKEKEENHKVKSRICNVTIADLWNYNVRRLKNVVVCLICVIIRRDPGVWGIENDMEFSSLGFSKSKRITERERKKLGSVPSFSRQSTPIRIKRVEEKNRVIEPNTKTSKSKYDLPTEVWLYEIECQLDELYSRASALADIAYKEIPSEPFPTKISVKSEDTASPKSGKQSDLKSASATSMESQSSMISTSSSTVTKTPANESKSSGKPPLRKEQRSRISHATLIPTSSAIIQPSMTKSPLSQPSNEVNNPAQSSSILPQEQSTVKERRSTDTPKKVYVKRRNVQTGDPGKRTGPTICDIIPTHPERRKFGWMLGDRIADSTENSRAPSSCLDENASVPALTAHNLARHNYSFISRQSSGSEPNVSAPSRRANTVQLLDAPCTSTAVCELPAAELDTLPERLWKKFSSFKRLMGQGETQDRLQMQQRRTLRRSRTTAINIKDIPSLDALRDSDNVSDRNGKKSSASTSKLRSVFKNNVARRNIGSMNTDVDRIQVLKSPTRASSVSPSVSPQSEMTSLPSRTSPPSRISGLSVRDDVDTFSIPGTVSEDSHHSLAHSDFSHLRENMRSSRSRMSSQDSDMEQSDIIRARRRTPTRSLVPGEFSRRRLPARIQEEDHKENEGKRIKDERDSKRRGH